MPSCACARGSRSSSAVPPPRRCSSRYAMVVPSLERNLERSRLDSLERTVSELGPSFAVNYSQSDDRNMVLDRYDAATSARVMVYRVGQTTLTGDLDSRASRPPLPPDLAIEAVALNTEQAELQSFAGRRSAVAVFPFALENGTFYAAVFAQPLTDVAAHRRPRAAPSPDRRRHRVRIRSGHRPLGLRAAGPPPAAPASRRRAHRGRAVRRADPRPGQRRGRRAGALVRDDAPAPRRSSTRPAASSSRTPRTSCARRSPRWAAISSWWARVTSTRRRAASSSATMREQIDRLTKLASDLLDLSRLDAGASLVAQPREIDLTEIARDCVREAQPVAVQRHATVEARTNGEVPALGDDTRVRQIVRALVDNALRHTPEGTHIRVSATAAPWAATISVSDDGPGIAADAQRARLRALLPRARRRAPGQRARSRHRERARRPHGRHARAALRAGRDGLHADAEARVSGRAVLLAFGCGLAGALCAVALAGATGVLEGTTTVREAPLVAPEPVPVPVGGKAAAGGMDASAIYRARAPGVVQVEVRDGGNVAQTGSGWVADAKRGAIVTNAHVITNAGDASDPADVKPFGEVYVELDGGERAKARVLGYDLFDDVAVLQVEPGALPLTEIPMGHSSTVQVGEPVAVIGSPFGAPRLALGRRRLAGRPPDRGPGAALLRHGGGDPDGRRHEPRQLRRPDARRARPRDRRQLADQRGAGRRQRRRRLRDPHRRGAPLAAPDPGARPVALRLAGRRGPSRQPLAGAALLAALVGGGRCAPRLPQIAGGRSRAAAGRGSGLRGRERDPGRRPDRARGRARWCAIWTTCSRRSRTASRARPPSSRSGATASA